MKKLIEKRITEIANEIRRLRSTYEEVDLPGKVGINAQCYRMSLETSFLEELLEKLGCEVVNPAFEAEKTRYRSLINLCGYKSGTIKTKRTWCAILDIENEKEFENKVKQEILEKL